VAIDDFDGETVLEGSWRYAGRVLKVVEIVAEDGDYF
jgi:hypothetical protein